jgi:HEAT repeat protein
MAQPDVESLLEQLKGGDTETLISACDELLRSWRAAPVEELLLLKEQFRRLNLEHREAHVEELLVSIAEKRPAPFTAIITQPDHPLWRPALEVLSLLADNQYLDLFITLLPVCPKKELPELVKAIGCYRCDKAAHALESLLDTDDDTVFMESVLALRRCGGQEAVAPLKEALYNKRREGSELASVVEAVLKEIESMPEPKRALSNSHGNEG